MIDEKLKHVVIKRKKDNPKSLDDKKMIMEAEFTIKLTNEREIRELSNLIDIWAERSKLHNCTRR